MEFSQLDKKIQNKILLAQKNEITEYHVYKNLSRMIKDKKNSEILNSIAEDEKLHHGRWKQLSGRRVKPSKLKIWYYTLISRVFGLAFGLKLMERGEKSAQSNYKEIMKYYPSIEDIINDEDRHEHELLNMLDEEKLQYVGSIVLGLNDALVELTGALAGLTFALQNSGLIATTAFITGIAASLSMAASEYLSTKTEGEIKNPLKAAVYTGITYVVTVVLLILPYVFVSNYFVCLGIAMTIAVFIIFFFNFYISVAKELSFGARFFEMLAISFGVAILSFGIGIVVRTFFHVEI